MFLLLRVTARGFYLIPQVIVLEAIMLHKVLLDEDLRHLLGILIKELRAVCSGLIEDRIISEFKQREPIPGKEQIDPKQLEFLPEEEKERITLQQFYQRTYYFIRFSLAVDLIKWKVDLVVRQVDKELNRVNEKGYVCPTCKKHYSELEVQSLFNEDFTGVFCSICSSELVEDNYPEEYELKQARLIKLKGQLDPILQWLKKIDEIKNIEDYSINQCFLARVPASDVSTGLYTRLSKGSGLYDAVAGYDEEGKKSGNLFESTTIRVNISGDNEDELRRQQEIAKLKLEKAEQNALPSWYQESTVGKESSKSTVIEPTEVKLEQKPEEKTEKSESDEISAYYERLKAKGDEQEEEEEEEDFDFEDV